MPDAAPRSPAELAAALQTRRAEFKAFLAARVGGEAEAEDILQAGLLKALRSGDGLRDEEKATAWFYRLLRRAVIDHYRARGAERRRTEALGGLVAALEEDRTEAAAFAVGACGCLGQVIATLPPPRAELLRRVDLDGESVQSAAAALGLTPNHASVTLHRARRDLRVRLEAFCGECSEGACLACDCGEREEP